MLKNIGAAAAVVLAGAVLGGCVAYGPPGAPAYGYGPAPAPAVNASIVIGWHGDQYWDGQRYWARDDWERRHPEDRRHDDHDDHHDHGDDNRQY
jgi:hypothetical protein